MPILSDKSAGPVYAVDKAGHKLMVEVGDGGQITVRVESAK
jgi:hypothetical protein